MIAMLGFASNVSLGLWTRSTVDSVAFDAAFEKKSSSADQPYFVLKAPNGLVIGTSQMYSSEAARETGIASVITHAATTDTKEA